MTQENKELLLKDLSARLPYGVKVYNTTFREPTIQTLWGKISEDEFLMEETYTSVGIDGDDFGSSSKRHYSGYIDSIKPYLRPMSSMTEDERKTYLLFSYAKFNDKAFDWLNQHHFDYRYLINKGLALEAPKGMYK